MKSSNIDDLLKIARAGRNMADEAAELTDLLAILAK
jgi:hypothetical protein